MPNDDQRALILLEDEPIPRSFNPSGSSSITLCQAKWKAPGEEAQRADSEEQVCNRLQSQYSRALLSFAPFYPASTLDYITPLPGCNSFVWSRQPL